MIDGNTKNHQHDLILIRHGQSNFNRGHLEFLQSNLLSPQLIWEDCIKLKDFNLAVSYAKEYFDSSLTPEGVKQCKKAREIMQNQNPEIVLVSPYHRALETCRQIFGDRNIKIEVHPLLAQVFRFACDIGHDLELKKAQFKDFDFKHMQGSSQLWFIEHLAPHHQQTWRKYEQNNENLSFERKQELLLSFVKEKHIYQTNKQLRERIWKMKELLAEYKKKYKKIAIVSHFCILNALLAEKFHKNGDIVNKQHILNAHPYFASIQRLLQFK